MFHTYTNRFVFGNEVVFVPVKFMKERAHRKGPMGHKRISVVLLASEGRANVLWVALVDNLTRGSTAGPRPLRPLI